MYTKPKNVLFLFADQMHAFALGCMGNADIDTPNLDRLAASGTLFENCYSSNPVCSPYRATLFNGRYSCQTGMIGINNLPMPAGERCLPELLEKHGIHTSYVGKWHIGDSGNRAVPESYRCGFSDFIGFQCVNDFFRDIWFFDEDGVKHTYQGHRTNATTDVAIERLKAIKDDPFCMFVSYSNPHYPLHPDKEYAERYWSRDITLRPNFQELENPFHGRGGLQPREEDPEHTRRNNDVISYIKMYYAMITQLDAEIGRLIDRLEDWGLMEYTMIVFTSDHGDMQGSHGLSDKHVHYEESTRVPLIVRVPGTSGHTVRVPVGTTDFMPTILETLGAPIPPAAEGRSVLDLASGGNTPHKDAVFVENPGGNPRLSENYYLVVRGHHKMVVDQQDFSPRHLYDLEADPFEMNDLVNQKQHSSLQRELVALIENWHTDVMSRANPNRWQRQDAQHWMLWRTPPPTDEVYENPELIGQWCHRNRH